MSGRLFKVGPVGLAPTNTHMVVGAPRSCLTPKTSTLPVYSPYIHSLFYEKDWNFCDYRARACVSRGEEFTGSGRGGADIVAHDSDQVGHGPDRHDLILDGGISRHVRERTCCVNLALHPAIIQHGYQRVDYAPGCQLTADGSPGGQV
jgi:hypothetical protein